jgi:acetyl esterase
MGDVKLSIGQMHHLIHYGTFTTVTAVFLASILYGFIRCTVLGNDNKSYFLKKKTFSFRAHFTHQFLITAVGLIIFAGAAHAQTNAAPAVAAPPVALNPQIADVAKTLDLPTTDIGGVQKNASTAVTYKTVNGVALQIHVYTPPDLKSDERRPALFFIHGGGWVAGNPYLHALECVYFSRLGMVTAAINYRLLPDVGGTPDHPVPKIGPLSLATSPADCLADAKSAMRYFRAHAAEFHVDPDKIIVCGDSAGAHLAAALASIKGYDDPADDQSVSTRPAAVILMCPAFDLVTGWKNGQVMAQKAGLDIVAFSPALQADKDFPPALLLAGSVDGISTKPSEQFIERIKGFGGDAELVEFAGQGHGFYQRSPMDPHFQAVIYFMDKFLTRLGYLSPHESIPAPVIEYKTFSTK